jgi:hypothetical protein
MSIVENIEQAEGLSTETVRTEDLPISEIKVVPRRHRVLRLSEKIKLNYKILSRKLSYMLKGHKRTSLTQILYVSSEDIPEDYILSLQKQYPDKEITVIIPLCGITENLKNYYLSFDYFYRNTNHEAKIVKYPTKENNIKVYGIYSEAFSKILKSSEIYQMKYMSAYAKCARIFAEKLNADIIHADNIPFLLGSDFETKQKIKSKIIQSYHHMEMFPVYEPFWAAINLADKNNIEKITKDRIIKKYLAKLFNIKKIKSKKTIERCLDYFYENYDKFRSEVSTDKNIEQNSILRGLNKRIVKLFPGSFSKKNKEFDAQYYSAKKSNRLIITSNSLVKNGEFNKKIKYLQNGINNKYKNKIVYNFNVNNFRNIRTINRNYLQREFGKGKIESKFTDRSLLQDNEIEICGYLDTLRTSAIIFANFDGNATEDEYKSVIIPVLKAFELNKDIQFILNTENASKNSYIKSLIDFFETQRALDGRWLFIDGQINLPQFLAASNIYLIHSGQNIQSEEIIYTALKYGCIPVIFKNDEKSDILKDIFDDMNEGCCFKLPYDSTNEIENYEELIIKVLNFYFNNSSSWNIIVKNAMNYDSSWNFEKIQAFNSIYDEL